MLSKWTQNIVLAAGAFSLFSGAAAETIQPLNQAVADKLDLIHPVTLIDIQQSPLEQVSDDSVQIKLEVNESSYDFILTLAELSTNPPTLHNYDDSVQQLENLYYNGVVVGVPHSWARLINNGNAWYGTFQINGEMIVIEPKGNLFADDGSAEFDKQTVSYYAADIGTSELQGEWCAVEHDHATHTAADAEALALPATTVLREFDLDLMADYDFYQRHGANTKSKLLDYIHQVDPIYQRDLKIKIKIDEIQIYTDSDNQLNEIYDAHGLLFALSDDLLIDNDPYETEDLVHLFTSRELNGSTVGVAYLDVICDDRRDVTAGLSQECSFFSTCTVEVIAHEIGHNISMNHDDGGNYIMSPVAQSSNVQEFSSMSKTAAAGVVGRSCFRDYEVQYAAPTIDSISGSCDESGTCTIQGTASDTDNDLVSVSVYKDGDNGIVASGKTSWRVVYNSVEPGEHSFRAIAQDATGLTGESDTITLHVEEPMCAIFTSNLAAHESAGRTYSTTETEGGTCWGSFCWGGTETTTWYAIGSDENLGTNSASEATLYEYSSSYYSTIPCTADEVAPIITLNGSATMQVYQGSAFNDPGAVAIDDRDGDISTNITVSGAVDVNTLGEYQISYNVSDAAGNVAQTITRNVIVLEAPECMDYSATATAHESAGRAYSITETTGQTCYGSFCFGGTTTTTWYATGSDQNISTDANKQVTLKEQPVGYFSIGKCPADGNAPVVTVTDWDLTENTLVITGSVSDANDDLVRVSVSGTGLNAARDCDFTTSTYACNIVGLADGDYSLVITAYDQAGNVSDPAPNPPISFKIGADNACVTATNYSHVQEGRAHVGGASNIYAYANGSNDDLGLVGSTYYSVQTSVEETSADVWEKVNNCN